MSELDNLYYRRSVYRSRKRECEESRAAIKRKIERLEAAKSKVAIAKKDAVEAKDYIANRLSRHTDTWVGSVYRDVEDVHHEINSKYSLYYNDIDYILDQICDEITRLENENRNLGFVLNGIINTLNNIGNEIEKWLN